MNKCIIMLQNKLLTFYFRIRLHVRKMENVLGIRDVLELAVSRGVVGVRPMILSMSVRLQACACVPFIAVR